VDQSPGHLRHARSTKEGTRLKFETKAPEDKKKETYLDRNRAVAKKRC